jgi:hypothetical protein
VTATPANGTARKRPAAKKTTPPPAPKTPEATEFALCADRDSTRWRAVTDGDRTLWTPADLAEGAVPVRLTFEALVAGFGPLTPLTADEPGDAPELGDDVMAAMANLQAVIAKGVPKGLCEAVTTYDHSRSPDLDLIDVRFDCWDVQSAQTLVKYLPWSGEVRDEVVPGRGYNFHNWVGDVLGQQVIVVGPQPLGRTS